MVAMHADLAVLLFNAQKERQRDINIISLRSLITSMPHTGHVSSVPFSLGKLSEIVNTCSTDPMALNDVMKRNMFFISG